MAKSTNNTSAIVVVESANGSPLSLPKGSNGDRRVYAILFSDRAIKVGVTTGLRARIQSIQTEHRRFGRSPDVEKVAYSPECLNYDENERLLLAKFTRLRGRYLAADFAEVIAAMELLNYRAEKTASELERSKQAEKFFSAIKQALTTPTPSRADLDASDALAQEALQVAKDAIEQIRELCGNRAAALAMPQICAHLSIPLDRDALEAFGLLQ